MRGFGSLASASRFCRVFGEVRQFFRVRTTMKQSVSLPQQRELFRHRLDALKALVLAAYSPERIQSRSTQHAFLLSVFSVLTHPFCQLIAQRLIFDSLGLEFFSQFFNIHEETLPNFSLALNPFRAFVQGG
jgi:hypothetical protein